MKINFSTVLGLALGTLLMSIDALAGTLGTVNIGQATPLFPHGSVQVKSSLYANNQWKDFNSNAGMFDLVPTNLSGLNGFDPLGNDATGSIYAFCIELRETLPTSTKTYDIEALKDGRTTGSPNPIGTTRANWVSQVLSIGGLSFLDNALTTTFATGNGGAMQSYSTSTVVAAIQVAIWEVVYETSNTFSLTSGVARFDSTSSVEKLASYFLGQVNRNGAVGADNLFALNRVGNQDLVFQAVPTPPNQSEIPEPATVGLMGLGLLALGLFRKKLSA